MDHPTPADEPNNVETASAAIPLINKLQAYDHSLDVAFIVKAVDFAVKYHGTQKRASGDPYYHHPVAVAEILADMHLDKTTVVTALLHDTVEDTEATLEMIEEQFGEEIASLVNGVTKLTKIEAQSITQRQAENFRKFLIAMSEDIRVLIVKLADRLHNMRTLKYIQKPEKRARIAHETMEIYSVLAERIGMQNIKTELQDIAFQELHAKAYISVMNRLDYLQKSDNDRINRTAQQLEEILREQGLESSVSGRIKAPYSIWRKMQRKHVTFEQLSDIMAFRIVVKEKGDCYKAVGILHTTYHMIPGKFKDFISTPKNNGYQSIHSVVMGPEQQRIEVQIRTEEMHDIAEIGLAAHWTYKQGHTINVEGKQYRWIRELLQIIENASDADDLIENTRLEMYHDQVFCFTPRGDLIALPSNATPVDFAFAVHTDVGRRCVGAKVNGRIIPLRTKLKNGDQVDILLSKAQAPLASWSHFAVTGKAQSEIKKVIRADARKEYSVLGRELLSKFLLSFDEELQDEMLEPFLELFSQEDVSDVYAEIGEGHISRADVAQSLFPDRFKEFKQKSAFLTQVNNIEEITTTRKSDPVIIRGLKSGVAIHYAECCYPLPNEKITGIMDHSGITIHTTDCAKLEEYIEEPENWVNVSWDKQNNESVYPARVQAIVKHQKGTLAKLADCIARGEANINNLNILNRAEDFFEMTIDVEVSNIEHLDELIELLRNEHSVNSIWRIHQSN
jgi:guanosine-3',5'-bis(diphosphate) 3'-pyrophosphohydrolase